MMSPRCLRHEVLSSCQVAGHGVVFDEALDLADLASGTRRDPKWGSGSKWGTWNLWYIYGIYGVYYSLLDGMFIYIYDVYQINGVCYLHIQYICFVYYDMVSKIYV